MILASNRVDRGDCVWKLGKGNGEEEDLGILPITACVTECRKKQLSGEGFNAVAWKTNSPDIGRCSCLKHETFIGRDPSSLDSHYKVCFLKMLGMLLIFYLFVFTVTFLTFFFWLNSKETFKKQMGLLKHDLGTFLKYFNHGNTN